MEFDGRPEFCNLLGSIQGGILAAMLDLTMSFAALCTMGSRGWVVPTLEMKTNFIAPAQPGTIVGTGALVRKGRSVTFMEGQLSDPAGNLLHHRERDRPTQAVAATVTVLPSLRQPRMETQIGTTSTD